MLRRDFLRLGALGLMASPLVAGLAQARLQTPGHGHSMGAAGHTGWATQLPEQQALRGLPAIDNLTSLPNFRASLNIQPVTVPLTNDLSTQLWLYNGKVTPLIELVEGGEVEVAVNNQLEQPTTIHWHGVKLPSSQDGGPHDPIPPGGNHTYRFQVPVGNAGLHWFHPHPHGHLSAQIAHSLAGALLVRPRQDPMPESIPSYLLMVTDMRLDSRGKVAPHTGVDWMNGREGDILLVNGQRNPLLEVAPGATFRLRMINACAGRYLRLSLQQHGLQLIGTDGGYLEHAEAMDELLLVPGQRCDLLVRADERPGQSFALRKLPYDRGWMGPKPAHYRLTETLLTLKTSQAASQTAIKLPSRLALIPPLERPAVTRRVVLSEEMPGHSSQGGHGGHAMGGGGMMMNGRPPIRFMINGETFEPGRIMFEGVAGQVEEWEVVNDSLMDHPFHVHGTQFQVVSIRDDGRQWREPAFRAWQDTVNLKPRQSLKLRLVFEQPGEWMFHCHIIEHEELGMMASILIR